MTTETIALIATAVYAVLVVPWLVWLILEFRRLGERLDQHHRAQLRESLIASSEDWARLEVPTYLRANLRVRRAVTR